ncbi:MAG: tetratricopeptide repeat protein, partial [bacterium]
MLDFLGTSDPQRILERSRKLVACGRTERAIKTLEKGLRGDSADFDLLLELARLNLKQGSSKEAAAQLKRAYVSDPTRSEELINEAETLHYESDTPLETGAFLFEVSVERRNFDQANRYLDGLKESDITALKERFEQRLDSITKYKAPREMDSRDASVLYQVALLLSRTGEFDQADFLFKKGMEIVPEDRKKVVSEYERIASTTYGDPGPRVGFADLLVRSGNVKRAIEMYRSAIEFDKSVAKRVIDRLEKVKEERPDPEIEKYLSELYIAHSQIGEAISLVREGVSTGTIELTDAVKKLRDVVRLEPDNPEGHLSLGDAYRKDGSTDLAISEYKEAFQLDSGLAGAVIERLDKVIAKERRNPLAVSLLADIYLKQDDIPNAVDTMAKGFEADVAMADEVIPMIKEILERDIENSSALVLLCKAYASKGKTKEAMLILDSLISLGAEGAKRALEQLRLIVGRERDNLSARTLLGMSLLAVGSFDEGAKVVGSLPDLSKRASKIMQRVFELCRKRPELAAGGVKVLSALEKTEVDLFALSMVTGELLSMAGDLIGAGQKFKESLSVKPEGVSDVIAAFERLLKKDDQLPDVHMGLANCLLKTGNLSRAAQEFARVLSLDKDSFDEIIDRYYEMLRENPKSAAVRMAIVDAFSERGMWDQLREESERALGVLPAEQSGYFYLKKGQAFLERGLLTEAVPLIDRGMTVDGSLLDEAGVLIEKIVKLDPKNAAARLSKARIASQKGDFKSAASEFLGIQKIHPEGIEKIISEVRKILEENKTDANLHFCLGELLLQAGMIEEASGRFQTATEIDDSFADRAIVKYEEIISKKGTSPSASLLLGRAYLKKASFPLATQNLLAALRADPELREPVLHDLNEI